MADLPTRADLFNVGRNAITATPNIRINPAVIDIPGTDVNLINGAISLVGEEIVARLSQCLNGNFVETARGSRLDRVAFDRYGLTRFPSTPATADLFLSRPNATFGAFTYSSGSRVQTPSGVQFAVNNDVVFGALDLFKDVSATAQVAGLDGNVKPQSITQFADSPADSTLTVTNVNGAAGGAEAESDIEFRGRIRQFFPTIRRGTLGAIEFGALSVAGVSIATAIEIPNLCACGETQAILGLPVALVQLIVGDIEGNSTLTMLQQVRDTLLDYRAAGIPVEVIGGLVTPVAVTWSIDAQSGFDSVNVAAQVRAVTVAAAQFLNPGDTLFRSTLIAAARTVPGAVVTDASLVTPTLDVQAASASVIFRIQSEDITFI